jgi:hypothetical protein
MKLCLRDLYTAGSVLQAFMLAVIKPGTLLRQVASVISYVVSAR